MPFDPWRPTFPPVENGIVKPENIAWSYLGGHVYGKVHTPSENLRRFGVTYQDGVVIGSGKTALTEAKQQVIEKLQALVTKYTGC